MGSNLTTSPQMLIVIPGPIRGCRRKEFPRLQDCNARRTRLAFRPHVTSPVSLKQRFVPWGLGSKKSRMSLNCYPATPVNTPRKALAERPCLRYLSSHLQFLGNPEVIVANPAAVIVAARTDQATPLRAVSIYATLEAIPCSTDRRPRHHGQKDLMCRKQSPLGTSPSVGQSLPLH